MERNIQGLSNASQFGGTAAPSDELTTEAPSTLASTAFQRGAHTLVALIESERRKLREAADQKRAELEKELSEMSDKLSAAEQKVQELEAHCSTVKKELDTARNAQLTEQSEAQIWKERYVALDAQLAAAVSAKDAEIQGFKSRITIVEAENKRLQSAAVATEDKDDDIQMDMLVRDIFL
ncbi:uncharacterized protein LAESUDRAFT_814969 [Laetiporus sulphureus 93-53]|uniref:Uncharacterized protein n=1 Tax=Laetiporus sulphureus 93-53 TaxID=1314785 RepID=A0A165CKJ1_9APHY|nr:uncharacterized protein LAESUDRAFT_814969 [Laetiporus sulphureus 93-53]KZT02980.1 hypothetical protein LAESUDRAFT_814969 [Laetiporus sulphureus 93-53]